MRDYQTYINQYNISAWKAKILACQALTDKQIQQILFPEKESVFTSSKELENIIDRLYLAKKNKEKLVVIGDYDADGICATTIIVDALEVFGINCGFYIPNRLEEGYGISIDILKRVAEKGYSLVLTVDNGVAAIEALDYAKANNMEVIVTDHHIIPTEYDYDFLLHPARLSPQYQTICGAGVALLLVRRLLNDENVDFYYVLAMIATIADMMPVFDENRWIIQKGLALLKEKHYPSIEALLDKPTANLNDTDIAFQIVPKINTLGRLADRSNVNNLVHYFRLKNLSEIKNVATQINQLNSERKELTSQSLANIGSIQKVGAMHIVLNESLHEGVIGLVANKLVNELKAPVLVLTATANGYKGSGRSPNGFDIHAFFQAFESKLVSFGGHKNACGLEMKQENYTSFLTFIECHSEDYECFDCDEDNEVIELEAEELHLEMIDEINHLRPFGTGFSQPKLKINHFEVEKCSILAKKYIKWKSKNPLLEAVYFQVGLKYEDVCNVQIMSFFGSIQLNEFRNQRKITIVVDSV